LLTSHSSVAAQNTDASDDQARWFEIEIILFKHVNSNSTSSSENSEQFSSTDLSAKKRDALDLLAPYLQPDIASLKQFLPNCEQAAPIFPYNITPSILWADKVESDRVDKNTNANINSTDKQAALLKPTTERDYLIENKVEESKSASEQVVKSKQKLAATESSIIPSIETGTKASAETNTEKSTEANITASIELPAYNHYPINSQSPLCVIPTEFFQQNLTLAQLKRFNIDGFPVEKLPSTIDGLEQWQDDETGQITWASDQPYLISQDSLRLHSIANRINWSRNYEQLLHLGWRQTGESSRDAKAMQLYAGEHLNLAYQQALVKQEAEQLALEIEAMLAQQQEQARVRNTIETTGTDSNESLINQALPIASPDESGVVLNELSIAEQLRLQAKQQQLDALLQQFTLLTTQLTDQLTQPTENQAANQEQTFESIQNERAIKAIVAQLSTDITVEAAPLSDLNSSANTQVKITKPLQPWSIDGLFKVHLDHYLYINTEFNIIDASAKSSVKSSVPSAITAKQKLASQNGVISFKQDRRVITGEIHYFDHPNIGMVVQIRRFDPSAPADEAVTQSKK